MSQDSANDAASQVLALVHEGWAHLKFQRPLAAWASWQRALRLSPDDRAAQQALDHLKSADELPETARKERRFRNPTSAEARTRWSEKFAGRDLSALPDAIDAFSEIIAETPNDIDALENRALCLAWLGRPEAIGDLHRVTELAAETDFDRAVEAAKLGEILRQGAGAEPYANEFSDAVDLGKTEHTSPKTLYEQLKRREYLRRLPSPRDHGDIHVDEWLDRPWPENSGTTHTLAELPRVLGLVLSSDNVFRVSSPDASSFWKVAATLQSLAPDLQITRTPLPLPMLDAAVWTIRIPEWVNEDDRHRLYRENVEDYYENRWINIKRAGLLNLSPLEAAQKTDAPTRARLAATIAIREELAARPGSVELYQGYPFDRLRKRLGIEPDNPDAVNAEETGSMSGSELDSIDPGTLDDHSLVEAFQSAAALGNDSRTVRFASVLVDRKPSVLEAVNLKDLFAPLIRAAIADGDEELAQRRIDQAIDLDQTFGDGELYAEFTVWKAELLCGLEQPDAATEIYRELAESGQQPGADTPAWIAYDGATTLYDAGYADHARTLAELTLELADAEENDEAARETTVLLERLAESEG